MTGRSNERTPHYLRANLCSKQPRRHVFIDTEASIEYSEGVQTQAWLCGVARFYNADPRRKTPATRDVDYVQPGDMWADITAFTRAGSRTVVWAHNLGYDLRISRALIALPELGWSLRAIVLDGRSVWARFAMGKRSLVLADFTSWCAEPLAKIGGYLDMGQATLPVDTADLRGYLRRCRRDVDILATAVLTVLAWLERNDLGNWQITGSGQSWSTYRHRFLTHKILVHDNETALAAERRAMWAGRTETYRHGVVDREPTYEFDLPRAYATIARDCEVPLAYVGRLPRLRIGDFARWSETRRLLCECVVQVTAPLVPTLHQDRILWPVGRFRTTLWDTEVHMLLNRGAKVRLYRTFVYTRGPALHEWAKWILAAISPDTEGVPPLIRRILKHWSRSLIGRFALRYRQWTPMGTADEPDLYLSRLVGKREPTGARLMHVGQDLLELGQLVEAENSVPAITGWITAECRRRLWDLMESAGLRNVYYVDTDSLIVNAEGRRRLLDRIGHDGGYGLSLKRSIRRLELCGPRNLATDDHLHVSGVPVSARRINSSEYVGDVWQGFGEALATGDVERVVIYERRFAMTGQDQRRKWLPDGTTEPYRLP